MKKAQFIRKALNLQEVEAVTKRKGEVAQPFKIVEELQVSDVRYQQITNNLMQDIEELEGQRKGGTKNGVVQAIRIRNQETEESFLADPEGYTYLRYAAVDKK